ncbi:hypothetical protein [Methylocystis sp. ATCC 49242]|uniref:hypothetical protein n=1 Tax=Methylocystis sp. ATCC 49242 TaxID=622637 RepID=UPI00130D9356|nr:hypothetical protein [Methylocystis sp. ATCC 49242]
MRHVFRVDGAYREDIGPKKEKATSLTTPLLLGSRLRARSVELMHSFAAHADDIGAPHGRLVIEKKRAIFQCRFENSAQPMEQGLISARDFFAKGFKSRIVSSAREFANDDDDESANFHTLLMGSDADPFGEAATDARKRRLGDHFVGTGMDQIRDHHGDLRFPCCSSPSSFIFVPAPPSAVVGRFHSGL